MIQHSAEGGFTNEVSRLIREVDIVDLGEDEVRDGGEEGAGPAEGGDDGGPLDVGHGEDVERGADGQVALQRERQDRQNRGVRGAAIKPSQPMCSIVMNYFSYLSERKDLILQNASPNV